MDAAACKSEALLACSSCKPYELISAAVLSKSCLIVFGKNVLRYIV